VVFRLRPDLSSPIAARATSDLCAGHDLWSSLRAQFEVHNCRVIEHDLPVNGAHEEISMNFELVQEQHFFGQVSTKVIAFSRHRIGLALAVALFAAMGSNSFAQTYPSKLVTILVGFPAGGPADGTARILSEELAKI
jgi:hypothetical protein